MKRFRSSIEPLESRIAPAVFFVNGTNLTVTTSTGVVDPGVPAAAAAAGATVAILLQTGDSLVYDLNGHHKADSPADITFVKVTAGEAMAFFTDVNGSGKFDLNEFTGLAVSNGVKATINGEIHGSIDTLLDSTGAFTLTRQPSSIAGLTIAGTVDGNIQAGGSISHITFSIPKTGAEPFDLTGSILTGSAASDSISLNGGGETLTASFAQAAGAAGGSISNLVLPRGLEGCIAAGSGGNSSTANGGAGGNITHVILSGAIGYLPGSTVFGSIFSGSGGNVLSGPGQGGAAGGSAGSLSLSLTISESSPESPAAMAAPAPPMSAAAAARFPPLRLNPSLLSARESTFSAGAAARAAPPMRAEPAVRFPKTASRPSTMSMAESKSQGKTVATAAAAAATEGSAERSRVVQSRRPRSMGRSISSAATAVIPEGPIPPAALAVRSRSRRPRSRPLPTTEFISPEAKAGLA